VIVAQESAHQTCRNIGKRPKGCRDPKCSLDCHQRWAFKMETVIKRYMDTLPPTYRLVFGSIKLDQTATLDDWAKAYDRLQDHLRRWEKRTGHVCRLLLGADPTAVDKLHYDLIGYTSASVEDARQAVKDGWRGVSSLTPMRSRDAAIKYFCKGRRHRGEYRFLLVRHRKLKQLRGTQQFFRDTSIKALWAEWRKDRFGDKPMPMPTYSDAVQNTAVQEKIRQMVTIIANECPSKDELRKRAGMQHDMVEYVLSQLRANWWLLEDREGIYFHGTKCNLPPRPEHGRDIWEQRTGQDANGIIKRFARVVATSIAMGRKAGREGKLSCYTLETAPTPTYNI